MRYNIIPITYNDILMVNKLCLLGEEPFQVLDYNRIESALGNQFAPYEMNEEAYASVYKSLVINHGFANGNKRTGVIALYLGSIITNNPLDISDEELALLTYKIAGEGGSLISVKDIANKVFKNKPCSNKLHSVPNMEEVVKEYISSHKWLMEELAK